MTNASGTPCFKVDYLPYGLENTPSGFTDSCSTSYKFTGYERDTETGLDYAFARYYNQRLARFMSGDPLGGDTGDPQSLNRYAYVGNNPINFVDPAGMDCEPPDMINDTPGCADPPPPNICEGECANGRPDDGTCRVSYACSGPAALCYFTHMFCSSVPQNPVGSQAKPQSTAASNGNYCSVLDPNCKTPGPVTNYLTFLGCEYNSSVEQLTDEEDAQAPVALTLVVTAVVGAIRGKLAPWLGFTGAITGGVYVINMAATANKECTQLVYGH
jgi:RHS repeat-associated protein